MSSSPQRLRTNIQVLDDHLGGGIPPGAIVTLSSDPRTQSELLLHKLVSGSDTVYISTVGNEDTVEAEFQKSNLVSEPPDIRYVDPSSPLQSIRKHIEKLGGGQLVIVNYVNVIESGEMTSRGEYQEFVNWVQNMNRHTGNIVLFHRHRNNDPDYTHITNSISDIIFEIDEAVAGEEVTNYLHMPKCRGGSALDERLELEIGQDISVDTSRDIA